MNAKSTGQNYRTHVYICIHLSLLVNRTRASFIKIILDFKKRDIILVIIWFLILNTFIWKLPVPHTVYGRTSRCQL